MELRQAGAERFREVRAFYEDTGRPEFLLYEYGLELSRYWRL